MNIRISLVISYLICKFYLVTLPLCNKIHFIYIYMYTLEYYVWYKICKLPEIYIYK